MLDYLLLLTVREILLIRHAIFGLTKYFEPLD